MSSFTNPLRVEITQRDVKGRTLAVLLEDFSYWIGEETSDDFINVKAGFETDFASVPRALWWLCPPLGPYGKATVVHDWGYVVQERTRKGYDLIFLEAMQVLGVAFWKRYLMYLAVRAFGWRYWNRRADIKAEYQTKEDAAPGKPDPTIYGRRDLKY